MAIFFELYWLDILPMGIAIPPLSSLAFLLSVGVAVCFNISTPDYLVLPMVLAMAFAYLGSLVEYRSRVRFNARMEELEHWSAEGNPTHDITAKIAVKALMANFVSKFALFCISFAIITVILKILQNVYGTLPRLEGLNWHVLLIIAAIGGLLALRVKHAFLSFLTVAAGLIVYVIV